MLTPATWNLTSHVGAVLTNCLPTVQTILTDNSSSLARQTTEHQQHRYYNCGSSINVIPAGSRQCYVWRSQCVPAVGLRSVATSSDSKLKQRFYSRTHEYVEILEQHPGAYDVKVGLSNYALSKLGSIFFVEADSERGYIGARVQAGDSLAVVETVKSVADVITPVGGLVLEISSSIFDDNNLKELNSDAEGDASVLFVLRVPEEEFEKADLMNAAAYEAFTKSPPPTDE